MNSLKIIHVPFVYFPDSVGGTEVYVQALVKELRQWDVQSVIAAPADANAAYSHDGFSVRRFAVSNAPIKLTELYAEGDRRAAAEFSKILDEEQPDLINLHAFTSGVSLCLVRAARARGLPIVFTYHTPTVSCQRGTLMRWGSEVCDGQLQRQRCTRCTLNGLGLDRASSYLLGTVPSALGTILGKLNRSGGIWTALRMSELIQLRHEAFHNLANEVDHIIALCHWIEALLLRNGIPSDKVTVLRHGLAQPQTINDGASKLPTGGPLRIAYLGRLDPTKGPDIVIRALRKLPEANIHLDLYGIVQSEAGTCYRRQLEALAGTDPRISFLPPVPGSQVTALLQGYHLLAVPSRWLETGPLVVLEAFAAGTPVLGSNLGGIAEWVEHGVNGLLIETDSEKAWTQVLQRLATDRDLLRRLKAGIRPPRTMGQVADEMLTIYQSILPKSTLAIT